MMKTEEKSPSASFSEKLSILALAVLFLHGIALGELPLLSSYFHLPKFPIKLLDMSSITPSSAKPYDSFNDFYPEYLRQHQDETIAVSIALGGVVGHVLFHYTRGMDNGAIEGLGMIGMYLLGMCVLSDKIVAKSLPKALLTLIIAYGFAWAGHFFFEHNKPATFIYPLYSLLGDFKLWYEITTQVRHQGLFSSN